MDKQKRGIHTYNGVLFNFKEEMLTHATAEMILGNIILN